jgi:hypothetical protein
MRSLTYKTRNQAQAYDQQATLPSLCALVEDPSTPKAHIAKRNESTAETLDQRIINKEHLKFSDYQSQALKTVAKIQRLFSGDTHYSTRPEISQPHQEPSAVKKMVYDDYSLSSGSSEDQSLSSPSILEASCQTDALAQFSATSAQSPQIRLSTETYLCENAWPCSSVERFGEEDKLKQLNSIESFMLYRGSLLISLNDSQGCQTRWTRLTKMMEFMVKENYREFSIEKKWSLQLRGLDLETGFREESKSRRNVGIDFGKSLENEFFEI